MLNSPLEVQSFSVLESQSCGEPIPFVVRALVFLSTAQWRPNGSVHPAICAHAERMMAHGWMIRGAWPRNYILWRNGTTVRNSRLPLLVLPLSFNRLSPLHINVFLATEMTLAECRAAGGGSNLTDQLADKLDRQLDRLCRLVSIESGVAVVDPRRMHLDVTRELETNLGTA